MATPSVLFDSREAAAALGVTVQTLHRWTKAGRIKAARASRAGYVYDAGEVARCGQLPRPKRGGYRGRRA